MKLFYAPASPFVRKVNVFAAETGLDKKIEWIKTNPWQAEEGLTTENPLSKIPTLITDDGMTIYDSRVICEYLDTLHDGEKLIPAQGDARWQCLRLQALADGILEAGILRLMEKKREAKNQSADWDKMQHASINRGLDYLESTISDWRDDLNIAVITIACVLGWLDFRFAKENWRENRKMLATWFESFSKRPSMIKTAPKDLT